MCEGTREREREREEPCFDRFHMHCVVLGRRLEKWGLRQKRKTISRHKSQTDKILVSFLYSQLDLKTTFDEDSCPVRSSVARVINPLWSQMMVIISYLCLV